MTPARTLSTLLRLLALPLLIVGCTSVRPADLSGGPVIAEVPFSHAEFALVLERFVDKKGQVDYAGLKADPLALDRYYYLLSRYSPDNEPDFFPSLSDRLTYWLNAYNAAVLKAVIAHYPIASVEDVRPPFPFRLLVPRKSGFFVLHRMRLGDRTTSLYFLENRVIRKRFPDPRIHFVLNCASRGCPRLRRQPVTPRRLDKQLDEATREFVTEERNVRIDDQERAVYLSAIFDWYRGDFLRAQAETRPDEKPTLLRYVAGYVPEERANALERAIAAGYVVRFAPYDWNLNDAGG